MFVLGCAATLCGNVTVGLQHGVLDAIVAGWPPLALIGTFESWIRGRAEKTRTGTPTDSHADIPADNPATSPAVPEQASEAPKQDAQRTRPRTALSPAHGPLGRRPPGPPAG